MQVVRWEQRRRSGRPLTPAAQLQLGQTSSEVQMISPWAGVPGGGAMDFGFHLHRNGR